MAEDEGLIESLEVGAASPVGCSFGRGAEEGEERSACPAARIEPPHHEAFALQQRAHARWADPAIPPSWLVLRPPRVPSET